MAGSITRTACPQCSTVGALTITDVLTAQPIGSFSLAGVQMKVSARPRPVLSCATDGCDFERVGEYTPDGGHAMFLRDDALPVVDRSGKIDLTPDQNEKSRRTGSDREH